MQSLMTDVGRGTSFNSKLSFRDKLVGEILGAYSQAFAFSDQKDAKFESNEETEEVREGFTAIVSQKRSSSASKLLRLKPLS